MEIQERLARLEADDKTIFHQLSEIKDEVKDIRRLTLAVEKIATKTESIDIKVDSMGSRLSAVEKEPAEEFVHYKRLVISAVVTALLSSIIAAVLTLIIRG